MQVAPPPTSRRGIRLLALPFDLLTSFLTRGRSACKGVWKWWDPADRRLQLEVGPAGGTGCLFSRPFLAGLALYT